MIAVEFARQFDPSIDRLELPCIIIVGATIIASLTAGPAIERSRGRIDLAAREHLRDDLRRPPHGQPLHPRDMRATLSPIALAARAMRAAASAAGASRSREVVEGSDITVSCKQKGDEEF